MWYRRKIVGWWALLATLVVFGISGFITFSQIDILDLYRKMGVPESQIDLIRRQGFMTRDVIRWMSAVGLGPLLAYLIWVKRLFRSSEPLL